MDFNEFADLADTGFESREPVKPEDEFFHSVYIAGQSRKNHIGVMERAGELQIRGVEYNLDSVNMIIAHIKPVLSKEKQTPTGSKTECFCYKEGNTPWYGSSGQQCGNTSAERAAVDYCKDCRAQIIVAGIYCNPDGQPILNNDSGKPIFLFIRGKGMKYKNVGDYLAKLYKMDLDPVFQPITDKSKQFEKSVVNNKRFVTTVTIGQANSAYGVKNVFEFNEGDMINNNSLKDILVIAKKTKDKFDEKMDWSKRLGNNKPQDQGILSTEPPANTGPKAETKPPEVPKSEESFLSFDDIDI